MEVSRAQTMYSKIYSKKEILHMYFVFLVQIILQGNTKVDEGKCLVIEIFLLENDEWFSWSITSLQH